MTTQAFAYIAQQHFTVIPPETGIPHDYVPGDIVEDFAGWDDYQQRIHINNGLVALALAGSVKPPVLAEAPPMRMTRVMPDKSIFGFGPPVNVSLPEDDYVPLLDDANVAHKLQADPAVWQAHRPPDAIAPVDTSPVLDLEVSVDPEVPPIPVNVHMQAVQKRANAEAVDRGAANLAKARQQTRSQLDAMAAAIASGQPPPEQAADVAAAEQPSILPRGSGTGKRKGRAKAAAIAPTDDMP